MTTLIEEMRRLRSVLTPIYGRGETEAMIRLIFENLKGWGAVDLIINESRPLSDFILGRIEDILSRLQKHEPLQYILSLAYFYGMNFKVGPGVLIPRPETEELVDMIAAASKAPDLHVLDVGTGSGCIAIALSRNLRFADVDAIDFSGKALSYARENAEALKANVNFIHADIFSWTPEENDYDIIVSNPPYIDEQEMESMDSNVLDYEPHEALFVPNDNPLLYYRRIAEVASEALRPGGHIYFEINPRHADSLKQLLEDFGFSDVEVTLDIHARKRFISALWPEHN